MIASTDFYDSPDSYIPRDDFLNLVKEKLPVDWEIARNSIWYNLFPPGIKLPQQGWKIHVSSTLVDALTILQGVLSVVIKHRAAMKFAVDSVMLRTINSREWVRGGAGKFITIYPQSTEQCAQLLELLYAELKDVSGPYILSDKRYKDSKVLYYRYGGINPVTRLRYDGRKETILVSPDGTEWVDRREPFFLLPPWVRDPFGNEPESNQEDNGILTLKDDRYLILQAIHFSNAGGVYLALDNQIGTEVIIKEARPYTDCDAKGNDARSIRENEWRVLTKLQGTGVVPRVIDFFQEWEHVFLVREFVAGQPLSLVPFAPSGLKGSGEFQSMLQKLQRNMDLAVRIQEAVETIHNEGVVLGDLSADNIVIDEDGNPKLIDLDAATLLGEPSGISFFTIGFSGKERRTRFAPTFEDDYYSLGCLLFWMILPINGMFELSSIPFHFLEELEFDYGLPSSIRLAIGRLLNNTKQRESDEEQKRIPRIELATYSVNGMSKLPRFRGISDTDIDVLLQQLILGVKRTATLARTDRLFPSDPALSNPLGVAHGALGVVYALNLISGEVPDAYKDWIRSQELSTKTYTPSLYHGLSGIGWAMYEIGLYDEAMEVIKLAGNHPLLLECADIEHGVSGFGLANLYFWMKTGQSEFLKTALDVGTFLTSVAKWDENGPYWLSPDGRRFLGYARGNAGIALFLLYLYLGTREKRFLDIGVNALKADIAFGVPQQGGYISFPEEPGGQIVSPYWRYGSAGICTTLIRYAVVTKDPELVLMLSDILPDVKRKYTVFPSLFSGLAGLGNLLLDYHMLMGDSDALDVAKAIARGISLFKVQRDDHVLFPGELLYRFSADFSTGAAGIGLFLWRLRNMTSNFNFLLDELLTGFKNGASEHRKRLTLEN